MNDCRETIQSALDPGLGIEVESGANMVFLRQNKDNIDLDGKVHVEALWELLGRILGKDEPL